jgi:hypothetical protein
VDIYDLRFAIYAAPGGFITTDVEGLNVKGVAGWGSSRTRKLKIENPKFMRFPAA